MASNAPGPRHLKCQNAQYVECDSRFNETGTWTAVTLEMQMKGVTTNGYYEWQSTQEFYELLDGAVVASMAGKLWDPNRQKFYDPASGQWSDFF